MDPREIVGQELMRFLGSLQNFEQHVHNFIMETYGGLPGPLAESWNQLEMRAQDILDFIEANNLVSGDQVREYFVVAKEKYILGLTLLRMQAYPAQWPGGPEFIRSWDDFVRWCRESSEHYKFLKPDVSLPADVLDWIESLR